MALVLDGTTGTITNLVVQASQLPTGTAPAAGTLAYFGMSTAPTGWLKANGAAISRSTYADLFAAIGTTYGTGDGSTTFNIPDLRGEFPRGWDDGRGVDSGRGFGTAQSDEYQSHNHTLRYNNAANSGDYGSGGNYLTAKSSGLTRISDPGSNARTGTMINNAGGSETRPRNIALLACIKY